MAISKITSAFNATNNTTALRVLVIGGDAPASFPFETASVEKCSDTLPGCLAGGCSSIELANYKYTGKPVDVVYVRKGTEAQVHAWVRYACDVVKPAVAVMGDGYADANVRKAVFSALCGVDLSEGDLWAAGTEKMLNPPEHGGAIVWCTDGSDRDLPRFRASVASFRARMHDNCPFFVIASPKSDFKGIDDMYGVRRIDPTPYLQACGLTEDNTKAATTYAFPYAALFRLVIPLVPELRKYTHVLYVDTDTGAIVGSRYSPADFFSYEFSEGYELLGFTGDQHLSNGYTEWNKSVIPEGLRAEFQERVWGRYNYRVRPPVNSGVLLWNIPGFSRTWLLRRLRAIQEMCKVARFTTADQGIINASFVCDVSLSPLYNDPYVGSATYDDLCGIRHYCSDQKSSQLSSFRRSAYSSIATRCAQYPAVPYSKPVARTGTGKTCAVWLCNSYADADGIKRSVASFTAMRKFAGKDIESVVLTTLSCEALRHAGADNVVSFSDVLTASGFACASEYVRHAWCHAFKDSWLPALVPFAPVLSGYDTAFLLSPYIQVHDAGFFNAFELDVSGYDCAMCVAADNWWYTRENAFAGRDRALQIQITKELTCMDDDDANYVIGRLRAGLSYSDAAVLLNIPQVRHTLQSAQHTVELCEYLVNNGAGMMQVPLTIAECMLRVMPLSGSYAANGSTYDGGTAVYATAGCGIGGLPCAAAGRASL